MSDAIPGSDASSARLRTILLAFCTAATFTERDATAQEITLEPAYGSAVLGGGFEPDPYTVQFPAGGLIPAEGLAAGCGGYFNPLRPDYRIHYTPGQFLPLRIFVESDVDTTLIVNDPAGDWHCDDDSGSDVNPAIQFPSPQAGEYHMWIGVFSQSDIGKPARLNVSELAEFSLEPAYGSAVLRAGFVPDPHTVQFPAGGLIPAEGLAAGCGGYINPLRPDYRIRYTPGQFPFRIFVESDVDTTLIVNDPVGDWHCDDDSGPGANPAIEFRIPESGEYHVWVGVFSQSDVGAPARLHVSERPLPASAARVIGTGFFVASPGYILVPVLLMLPDGLDGGNPPGGMDLRYLLANLEIVMREEDGTGNDAGR